ncbi:bifunctional serine/threonine-protein kinase/ABC transporter substrate-binding protein [Streptomyces cavernicola]|uniref:Bifunctional serine/threonine-protein kinase/ABC transporter substrate-binding protein n=1 Tax=Streptomyces cavernicola TaxID=3043613 RepID=A0ABT6SCW1_9ACTN|nr:bifunctional serine/threonine-protein kinase/ABC transporter substrate-binding protein [Streptomyces sp. B-S-A6]MDI3405649.1 bifunctional serine/threonine-protein kinase/ABC transporter substrate-binding protein [Streptomyces sp. B-S-A6]
MTEPLLPGDPSAIGGHRLLGRLGAGGMGVVYLGRSAAGALAAVKVVLPELADEPDFRARFRREVEAARRVVSPWAAPVTGAGPDEPTPWLATEFVPGPSLGEEVRRSGPLPTHSVRALGRMLAAALRAVHAAGLVHRDVKPANVLLAVDGPRLIDFGIARSAGRTALTATGLVAGTPGFLSPEQAEARTGQLGPPSDVFSLGCLLAYASTGRAPFGEGAAEAMLYRTVHDEPDLAGIGGTGGADPDADALRALLTECLAKDPAARPAPEQIESRLAGADEPGGGWLPDHVVRDIADRSARMLALPGIEATLADRPTDPTDPANPTDPTAPTSTAVPAAGVASRRRFLLLGSGGALLAAGGGAALWAWSRGDDSPPDADRWALGVHADLSGPGKSDGRAHEQGVRLAVEQYNARRDKPFPLDLRTADDGGSERRARSAAQRLVQDRGVLAVVGPTSDACVDGAVGTYEEALLPMLLVKPGAFRLVGRRYRAPLHCRPLVYALGFGLAIQLTRQEKVSYPGLLQDRTTDPVAWEITQGVADAMRKEKTRFHPRVVPAGLDDLGPQVGEMLRAKVDSFVYAGHAEGAVSVARKLADAGFDGPRLGTEELADAAFLDGAGEAAEGWLLGTSYVDPERLPEAAEFVRAFRRRFDASPGRYAVEAYDAANLAIDRLVRAARDGRPPERARLAELLRAAEFRGVTKPLSFNRDNGRYEGELCYRHRVENSKLRFLGPVPGGDPAKGPANDDPTKAGR